MQEAVPAAEMPVSQHKISLPLEALSDNGLIVKAAGEAAGEAYALGTDYEAYYSEEKFAAGVVWRMAVVTMQQA